MSAFVIGPFRLEPGEHRLLREGQLVALTPKAFDTLAILVERRGHLVEKDELMRRLWPDSFVEEVTLARHISTLRRALGDTPEDERYIETVPKRGYRFVASVLEAPDHPDQTLRAASDTAPLTGPLPAGARAWLRGPWLVAVLLAAVVVLTSWSVWARGAPARWARNVALPEIERLVEANDYFGAYWLAREAEPHLTGSARLERFWKDRTFTLSLRTTPAGADVFVKPYRAPRAEWMHVGRTPLEGLRMPFEMLRWRITKDGFDPLETSSDPSGPARRLEYALVPEGRTPPGMVRVAGGILDLRNHPPVTLPDFWLDRHEVTNRQYQTFVDQGGYREPRFWRQPFLKNGRTLLWKQAVAAFVDATGRAGPATWELGAYPPGQGERPVSGVSWFEAAAYAEFVGKQLPTFHHWFQAVAPASVFLFSDVARFSNFGGHGPVDVGTLDGLSPYGNLDTAGNVREWVWNESRGQRYVLGGAWSDPAHEYLGEWSADPWFRAPVHGIRCAQYDAPLPQALLAPVEAPLRDYSAERPAPDEAFRIYRDFHSYDPRDLRPAIEEAQDEEHWRVETVSFDAAYGSERVPARLFLPRNAKAPYQTVVFCPTNEATVLSSSDDIRMAAFDYILRSGRAVLHPIYQGTYERRSPRPIDGPKGLRDLLVQVTRDFRRSIDYLETRGDIDRTRLAVFGVSNLPALLNLALEGRVKAGVLHGAVLPSSALPPEIDPINFLPRVRTPVLMLNGRYDPRSDETRERILFQLLGTPARDKRHVSLESGHVLIRQVEAMRETVDWLDRYLGPVERR